MYVMFLSLSHTKQNVKHWCDKAKETNQEAPSSSFLLWPVLKLSQHQFLSTKYIRGGAVLVQILCLSVFAVIVL